MCSNTDTGVTWVISGCAWNMAASSACDAFVGMQRTLGCSGISTGSDASTTMTRLMIPASTLTNRLTPVMGLPPPISSTTESAVSANASMVLWYSQNLWLSFPPP